MKLKSFKIVLIGLILSGFFVVKAESPDDASCSDSVTVTSSIYVAPPLLTYQSPLPVNENEIRAGLLYDAVNKRIIWQKEMETAFPIASLTKMMVALLAMEDVRDGKVSWTDDIKWTRETIVGRKKNRRKIYTNINYSLRDVFKATMIASNNECAEKLATYLGNGNLQATIERMNMRARQLDMQNTFYSNPTGLPEPHAMFDNKSSPADLLKLSLEMLKYDEVLEISAMGYATIENGRNSSVISNHNRLTIDYSGDVDGLKTGYTRRAGFCLVATTAKCDHRLISIVLGCRGPQIRNEVVRDMINDYYSSISLDRLGSDTRAPFANAVKVDRSTAANGRYVTVNEKVKKIHVVRSGESISRIAARYHCTQAQLKNWNKSAIRKDVIYQGQKLAVYMNQPKNIFIESTADENESDEDKPLMSVSEKKDLENATRRADADESINDVQKIQVPAKYLYHTIIPGDTLFKIALRYDGISVEDLKQLNNISDSRALIPGTKLKIKVKA
jgi:D-alanyl-D-alanine carboxypeptidase (penicillin-binding protein 5/6)